MVYLLKVCLFLALTLAGASVNDDERNKTHHHHHHHHKKDPAASHQTANLTLKGNAATRVQAQLHTKVMREQPVRARGKMEVNAPLPSNFASLFAKAAADATGCDTKVVTVVSQSPNGRLAEIVFEAPLAVVSAMENQAGDANSKLAVGLLCPFLVDQDADGGIAGQCGAMSALAMKYASSQASKDKAAPAAAPVASPAAAPAPSDAQESGGSTLDMDMDMPFGDLEPFGREDTAQELTESSIHESDAMVDQLERAEVAEEKRAVFRALTRLRGAAITSFDGIARQQTGNIDDFTKSNKWRNQHPVRHLAQEEADTSKWAFPDF